VDPNGIRSALETMLRKGECGRFVEDLINALQAKTKEPFFRITRSTCLTQSEAKVALCEVDWLIKTM